MGYEKVVSFDEFKSEVMEVPRGQKIDTTLTEEEIMEDVESILEQFRR